MAVYKTSSPGETMALGAQTAAKLMPGAVVAMTGELGAGKTVFVRGASGALGYNGPVTSPTFAIVNEYSGNVPLYHFDMYRIHGEEELYSTGFYDYLDGRSILFIEWSENISDCLPPECVRVDIKKDGEARIIEITGLEDERL